MVFYVCKILIQKVDLWHFLRRRRQRNIFACLCWPFNRFLSCVTLLLEVISKLIATVSWNKPKWKLVDYSKKRIGVKARSIGKRVKSIKERTHGKPCLRLFVTAMEILYIFSHLLSTKLAQKWKKNYDCRCTAGKTLQTFLILFLTLWPHKARAPTEVLFTWLWCDRKSRAAYAQSFAPWQQATIEIILAISLTIACSPYLYNGVIFHAHPVRDESHNQRNTTGEVATTSPPFCNDPHRSHFLCVKAELDTTSTSWSQHHFVDVSVTL